MTEYINFFGILASFQASFVSDLTQVCEQSVVSFTDMSSGSSTSWLWTFEGGSPANSSFQNPSVAYFTAGTYDVSLEVSNGTATSSIIVQDYMSVVIEPSQAATPEGDGEVCTNTTISSDYTTTGAAMAESYDWELLPSGAGTVNGTNMNVTIDWVMNWEGSATLKVKGVNDCGEGIFSQAFSILCSVCTGIDESTLKTGIEVYPNPSKGIFYMKFNANLGQADIRVVNMLNEVFEYKTINSHSGDIVPLDISEFPEGIYFLSIRAGGSEIIKKIVIH